MIAHDRFDFTRPRRLHLVGIGGSGMAPFARLLLADGHALTGADACASATVAALREAGVRVLTGAEADVLPAAVDAVIHSAAVPAGAAVLAEARTHGIPVLKYARAVGLYGDGKRTLAVAGTHGKTTTTAWLAYALRTAGHDASFLVGGCVPQLGDRGRGRSKDLVVEACEFDRSFLHLHPDLAIVTNMEADHLDYYKDIVEICTAFRTFAAQVRTDLVLHETLRETLGRAGGVRARVTTFGPGSDADVRVAPTREAGVVTIDGRRVRLAMPGFHNALNAAAVYAGARALGVDAGTAAAALEGFAGVGRRLQTLGQPRGVRVIDDYAHHPTEVAAGLAALRDAYAPRRLWVVFQPHQYSRLRRFLDEFAHALSSADRVVVPAVFAARDRDEDLAAVTPDDLVAAVRTRGGEAVHIPDFQTIVDFVRTQARPGDVVVTMGAGDVGDVAGRLAASL